MQAEVYNIEGQPTGKKVKLSDSVFAAPANKHAVYLAVKAQLANKRQGTHASKNRALVSGGGKKPWKQKGRGVARAGSTRSPLWVGGGRVFGPEPRDYSQKVNKQLKKIARRTALSAQMRDKRIIVLEDFAIESGKTKEMVQILNNFQVDHGQTLVLLAEHNPMTYRASRNIPQLHVMDAVTVSTYDVVRAQKIFIQQGAIKKLEEVLS